MNYISRNKIRYPDIDTSKNIMLQLPKLTEQEIKEMAVEIFESGYPEEKYSILKDWVFYLTQ